MSLRQSSAIVTALRQRAAGSFPGGPSLISWDEAADFVERLCRGSAEYQEECQSITDRQALKIAELQGEVDRLRRQVKARKEAA